MDSPVFTKKLNWKYDKKQILNNISIKIKKSSFTSILGPNGSGKTTLLKNLTRILEPEKGAVFIKGRDILKIKRKDLSRKISSVNQAGSVDFNFTVFEIVLMGRIPHISRFKSESTRDIKIAEKAMKTTGVFHLKDRKINNLSGGEKQRVTIARAITQEPEILFLDEPVTHLDIRHQLDIINLMKDLCKTEELTVVAVLHDLNLAIQYSDYIFLLKDGIIKAEGQPDSILTKGNIKNVYDVDVEIIREPKNNKSFILPV